MSHASRTESSWVDKFERFIKGPMGAWLYENNGVGLKTRIYYCPLGIKQYLRGLVPISGSVKSMAFTDYATVQSTFA